MSNSFYEEDEPLEKIEEIVNRPADGQTMKPISDYQAAELVVTAVHYGWDPGKDYGQGYVVADVRDIDTYNRYWKDRMVIDSIAKGALHHALAGARAYGQKTQIMVEARKSNGED